jgi:Helix-turn-helix domain
MSDLDITHGNTNVFADLGYPDATERQTKTRLALAVNELLKQRKLKSVEDDRRVRCRLRLANARGDPGQ